MLPTSSNEAIEINHLAFIEEGLVRVPHEATHVHRRRSGRRQAALYVLIRQPQTAPAITATQSQNTLRHPIDHGRGPAAAHRPPHRCVVPPDGWYRLYELQHEPQRRGTDRPLLDGGDLPVVATARTAEDGVVVVDVVVLVAEEAAFVVGSGAVRVGAVAADAGGGGFVAGEAVGG